MSAVTGVSIATNWISFFRSTLICSRASGEEFHHRCCLLRVRQEERASLITLSESGRRSSFLCVRRQRFGAAFAAYGRASHGQQIRSRQDERLSHQMVTAPCCEYSRDNSKSLTQI